MLIIFSLTALKYSVQHEKQNILSVLAKFTKRFKLDLSQFSYLCRLIL